MLSRAADAVYWLNRYIERAENTARFIDVNFQLGLDSAGRLSEQWEPLVITSGDRLIFQERYGEPSQKNVIHFLTNDLKNPNSIISCLSAARENARSVREIISSEMWEHVNRFYIAVKEAIEKDRPFLDPYGFYSEIKRSAHLFSGIKEATMSHGEGWNFGRLGLFLERADKTSRILDVRYFILLPNKQDVGTPFDNIQWAAVLKSASALEMYRKKWRRIFPVRVADFLIFEPTFPRSLYYSIVHAERALHNITGTASGAYRNVSERLMGKLKSELDYTEIDDIIKSGLHEFLDGMQIRLNEIGSAVFEDFIAIHPANSVLPASINA